MKSRSTVWRWTLIACLAIAACGDSFHGDSFQRPDSTAEDCSPPVIPSAIPAGDEISPDAATTDATSAAEGANDPATSPDASTSNTGLLPYDCLNGVTTPCNAQYADAGSFEPLTCKGKTDGQYCVLGEFSKICVAEVCVASSCGDGFVNGRDGEECEDGNDVAGDGCTNCQWDCTGDWDCDDRNSCNGDETCDVEDHRCVAGSPPPDLTLCTLIHLFDGTCSAGNCIPLGCGNGIVDDATEDCDDGNTETNDGCEIDCTFTCQTNVDCDDGDPCTGTETCNKNNPEKPVCVPGTEITCTINQTCSGSCDSQSGTCAFPDNDEDGYDCDNDCDDTDTDIHPNARDCLDGKDNDCDLATADGHGGECTCYLDEDNDGYAAEDADVIGGVVCPDGYTVTAPVDSASIDCLDTDADTFPGQEQWFVNPSVIGYDYNCDGVVTKRFPDLFVQPPEYCYITPGWVSETVPECGVEGIYKRSAYNAGPIGCDHYIAYEVQSCN